MFNCTHSNYRRLHFIIILFNCILIVLLRAYIPNLRRCCNNLTFRSYKWYWNYAEVFKWSNELNRDHMLGFLDEILPLRHLCCVQRDLIIGVSGNSCKSCRYFLKQSCRFIPGGWSTLITCNLINTVADLGFFFIAQSLTFRTMSTQLYDVLVWRYLCTWIVWKRLFYWHNNFQSPW